MRIFANGLERGWPSLSYSLIRSYIKDGIGQNPDWDYLLFWHGNILAANFIKEMELCD